MASKNIQRIIRNIFNPNLANAISAQDFQIFVDAIFESSESVIRKFKSLNEVEIFRQQENDIFIEKDDVIIITEGPDEGIYVAQIDKPSPEYLSKINEVSDVLLKGSKGQMLTTDGVAPYWTDIQEGYFIMGVKKIPDILATKSPKGTIYIAEEDSIGYALGGSKGDGYSFDGQVWKNIGPLQGPKGEVTTLEVASPAEIDAGIEAKKAITPLALKFSNLYKNNESSLGLPNKEGLVLSSTVQGARFWTASANAIEELTDTNITNPIQDDTLIFDGNKWLNGQAHKTVQTSDRPQNPTPGQMIFDLSIDKPLWFSPNKNAWIDANGDQK